MRRDTQIGVILGIVILVIIGVFLSTRPSVKETDMPVLALPEESVSVIEEIDIADLAKEIKPGKVHKDISPEESVPKETVNEVESEESQLQYGTLLEGKWEGIVSEMNEKEQELSEKKDHEVKPEEVPSSVRKVPRHIESEEAKETSQVVLRETRRETVHTVRSNENLVAIARRYYGDDTKWKVIFDANRGKLSNPNVLYVGLKLKIPNLDSMTKEDEPFREEKQYARLPVDETRFARTYTVQRGDTLNSIANKFYKDRAKWWKIYEANMDVINDKNILEIGDSLIIPE